MLDEPSNGELARRLEAVHQDLKEDLRDVAGRLDGKVSVEVFKLEQQAQDERAAALTQRVTAMESDARERDRQRAADRRLILTALVIPVLLVLLQVYLTTRGAGS
jgi:hypothetical protein